MSLDPIANEDWQMAPARGLRERTPVDRTRKYPAASRAGGHRKTCPATGHDDANFWGESRSKFQALVLYAVQAHC
jgi:hypothetical protein